MAKRDLLPVIRAARAGDAAAQLTLGRHYLFGGNGLPKNIMSALHWLDRAARQQVSEAWRLIGEHVPYDAARHAIDKTGLLAWYEKAFEDGIPNAGIALAKLVMDDARLHAARHARVTQALQAAALAGVVEAQWLLAQHAAGSNLSRMPVQALKHEAAAQQETKRKSLTPLDWAASTADAGLPAARHALAERAWAVADYTSFLRWSLPLAREVMLRHR